MNISQEQHNQLVAEPEPLTDAEQTALTEAFKAQPERRRERTKADLEGTAGSS